MILLHLSPLASKCFRRESKKLYVFRPVFDQSCEQTGTVLRGAVLKVHSGSAINLSTEKILLS